MPAPNKALKTWLSAAAPEQIKQLARESKTSVAQLRHIAHGRRAASADLAQRIAHASAVVRHSSPRGFAEGGAEIRPPAYLDQTELCAACGRCPIAARMADLES
jgi:transcriptional regulator with XRE-family HTH domain